MILLHLINRSPLWGLNFGVIWITTNRPSLCDCKSSIAANYL